MSAKDRFVEVSKLKYKDQAVWFLNGFWGDCVGPANAGSVWGYVEKCVELEKMQTNSRGEEGNELDQFWSAKFLEDLDETLTSSDRKDALRQIDQDNNGHMSLNEYLTWKFGKSVEQVADAPQGDNSAAIAAAQAKLDEVAAQLAECDAKIQAQAEAIERQKQAIADNEAAIVQVGQQQREVDAAKAELEAAVAELKAQEQAIADKRAALEAKSEAGGVSGMKAKNELAQLNGEDPLPLRKAKITQEAAVRRVQKELDALKARQEELKVAGQQLEQAKAQLEEAKADLERAYVQLESKMGEARAELERIRSMPGGGKGALWWMERELFEMDKRLPRAKQRYDHTKDFYFEP